MNDDDTFDQLVETIEKAKKEARTAKAAKRVFKPRARKPFHGTEQTNGGFAVRSRIKFNLPVKSLRGENIRK